MAEDLRARLIDPSDVGGLPVFNDDILQAQNNNRNTSVEYFDNLRKGINNYTGQLRWADSPSTSTTRDMGLIISGCVINKTVPAPYPVSEGYVFVDGEILKYDGGFIGDNEYIEMKKGAANTLPRTFKDGNSKDATISYDLDVNTGATGAFWTPSYTGVQIIVIADFYTEQQTIVGAQSLLTQGSGILKFYNNPAFTGAVLESYTTGIVRSRTKESYTNEASISVNVDTTTFSDAVQDYLIATLPAWSAGYTLSGIVYVRDTTSDTDLICNLRVLTNGQVWLRRPSGLTTWASSLGGSTYSFSFHGTAWANFAAGYEGYNTSFMTKS